MKIEVSNNKHFCNLGQYDSAVLKDDEGITIIVNKNIPNSMCGDSDTDVIDITSTLNRALNEMFDNSNIKYIHHNMKMNNFEVTPYSSIQLLSFELDISEKKVRIDTLVEFEICKSDGFKSGLDSCSCGGENIGTTENPQFTRCAFPSEVFTSSNWKCKTIGQLKQLVEDHGETILSGEQRLGILPLPYDEGFLSLGMYKSRGGLEGIWYTEEGNCQKISYSEMMTRLKDSGYSMTSASTKIKGGSEMRYPSEAVFETSPKSFELLSTTQNEIDDDGNLISSVTKHFKLDDNITKEIIEKFIKLCENFKLKEMCDVTDEQKKVFEDVVLYNRSIIQSLGDSHGDYSKITRIIQELKISVNSTFGIITVQPNLNVNISPTKVWQRYLLSELPTDCSIDDVISTMKILCNNFTSYTFVNIDGEIRMSPKTGTGRVIDQLYSRARQVCGDTILTVDDLKVFLNGEDSNDTLREDCTSKLDNLTKDDFLEIVESYNRFERIRKK